MTGCGTEPGADGEPDKVAPVERQRQTLRWRRTMGTRGRPGGLGLHRPAVQDFDVVVGEPD